MKALFSEQATSHAAPPFAIHQASEAEVSPQLESEFNLLRAMLLYRRVTGIESPVAHTVVLHFGRVCVTLHLERRADGSRIDGLLGAVLQKSRVTAAESVGGGTLLLRFGPLTITLQLERRPDAIRIDGSPDCEFPVPAYAM